MTVPADHVVCSTGECQNYAQILTPTQIQRYTKAIENYKAKHSTYILPTHVKMRDLD